MIKHLILFIAVINLFNCECSYTFEYDMKVTEIGKAPATYDKYIKKEDILVPTPTKVDKKNFDLTIKLCLREIKDGYHGEPYCFSTYSLKVNEMLTNSVIAGVWSNNKRKSNYLCLRMRWQRPGTTGEHWFLEEKYYAHCLKIKERKKSKALIIDTLHNCDHNYVIDILGDRGAIGLKAGNTPAHEINNIRKIDKEERANIGKALGSEKRWGFSASDVYAIDLTGYSPGYQYTVWKDNKSWLASDETLNTYLKGPLDTSKPVVKVWVFKI